MSLRQIAVLLTASAFASLATAEAHACFAPPSPWTREDAALAGFPQIGFVGRVVDYRYYDEEERPGQPAVVAILVTEDFDDLLPAIILVRIGGGGCRSMPTELGAEVIGILGNKPYDVMFILAP